MQLLRANTEVIVRIGPFVDVGDGFTPQTDITLGGDEAELLKAASVEVDISGNTWAATTGCRGWYDLTLTASNTDTEGTLVVVVQDDSDCLPVFAKFMVLAEAAWDSMFVAKDDGYMDVNVKAISEDTTAADNLELFTEVLENGTGLIDDGTFKANAITNAAVADDVDVNVKTITNGAITAAAIADAAIDNATFAADIGSTAYATNIIALAAKRAIDEYDPPTNAEMELRTLLAADYTIVSDLGVVQTGDSFAIVNGDHGLVSIQDDIDAILADTNELQGDWTNAGRLDAILDIIAADTTTDIPALIATAQADLDIITGATGVNLLAATQASIDAIEADTDELQVDDTPTAVAAVKTVVDALDTLTKAAGPGDLAAILAAIETDTIPELGVAAPAATPTLKTAIMLLYMALRNKRETTATLTTITNNAGATIAKATLADDATTFSKAEYISG